MDTRRRLEGALAGHYRIERQLGEGGMATVYLAEDLKHRRTVALKVLRPELSPVLGTERFLREIEVVARLNHPNILGLHDSGEAVRIAREVGDALPYTQEQRRSLGREAHSDTLGPEALEPGDDQQAPRKAEPLEQVGEEGEVFVHAAA